MQEARGPTVQTTGILRHQDRPPERLGHQRVPLHQGARPRQRTWNGGQLSTIYIYKIWLEPPNHYQIDVGTSTTPSGDTGGTVSGGEIYETGDSCTVSASANSGYRFVNWTEGGSQVSTSANYTFTVSGEPHAGRQLRAQAHHHGEPEHDRGRHRRHRRWRRDLRLRELAHRHRDGELRLPVRELDRGREPGIDQPPPTASH